MTSATAHRPLEIAVIGAGIAGMSAAWLLSSKHKVTVFEGEDRLGGHSHTVDAPAMNLAQPADPVDMGFIVYNEPAYPNLTALFKHLGVATQSSDMSFGVSLDGGRLEYGGADLKGWLAQPSNLFKPRFWSMLGDLVRFYRLAPGHACALDAGATSLGDYLGANGYGAAFQDDHLLPQAAAIWSAPIEAIRDYPAAAFIRFCQNHGLLKIVGRPIWRTVEGGSRSYVKKLTAAYARPRAPELPGAVCPSTDRRRAGDGRPRPRPTVRPCGDRRPRRPGPAHAGRSDSRRKGACSAPSATPETMPCCTAIRP